MMKSTLVNVEVWDYNNIKALTPIYDHHSITDHPTTVDDFIMGEEGCKPH